MAAKMNRFQCDCMNSRVRSPLSPKYAGQAREKSQFTVTRTATQANPSGRNVAITRPTCARVIGVALTTRRTPSVNSPHVNQLTNDCARMGPQRKLGYSSGYSITCDAVCDVKNSAKSVQSPT